MAVRDSSAAVTAGRPGAVSLDFLTSMAAVPQQKIGDRCPEQHDVMENKNNMFIKDSKQILCLRRKKRRKRTSENSRNSQRRTSNKKTFSIDNLTLLYEKKEHPNHSPTNKNTSTSRTLHSPKKTKKKIIEKKYSQHKNSLKKTTRKKYKTRGRTNLYRGREESRLPVPARDTEARRFSQDGSESEMLATRISRAAGWERNTLPLRKQNPS